MELFSGLEQGLERKGHDRGRFEKNNVNFGEQPWRMLEMSVKQGER